MSMGFSQMNSLLSSQTAMDSIKNMNSLSKVMKAETRTLASEIKMDKDRGVDTRKKENTLGKLEDNVQKANTSVYDQIGDLDDKITEDNKKIQEEKAAEEQAAKKAEEKAKEKERIEGKNNSRPVSGADKVSEPVSEPGKTSGAVPISPAVLVDISSQGSEAAKEAVIAAAVATASIPTTVQAPVQQAAPVPVQTGSVIDSRA